ncbi:hypothetical protein [Azospirillum largimobile]
MPKPARRDVVQYALLHLPVEHVLNRVEQGRKSATTWCVATIVFGGLLWLWLRAPSFNLLPAVIRAVLSIIGFLGYGIFGFANPMVVNAADYINIGYGILAGPPIMTLLVIVWWQRECRLADALSVLADHPMLAAVPTARIRRQSRVTIGYLLAAVALLGSTATATLRLFDLRAPESQFLCVNEARSAVCKHDSHWALPWPEADENRLGWFRPHIADWCIKPVQGLPGFQAVLPGSEFTQKAAELGRFKCVDGKESPEIEGGYSKEEAVSLLEIIKKSENIKDFLAHFLREDPYKNFPYVYPIVNILVFAASLSIQVFLLFLIFRRRSRV